ncbi:MAG: N-formylglutamate amidohydrolase [Caulobacteraceae bacterium]|nr:N-formylglutamate amidohydrolase [Caulobacteraceae bacterium]
MLGCDDPSPAVVTNRSGSSPFVLVGDHAGRAIPRRLGDLGLAPEAMELHIAWDIGISGLGARLAARLDACFVEQAYSRLVLDCNRKPGAPDCAPAVSDGWAVPGNAHLSPADLAARRREIYAPYQAAIAEGLEARAARPAFLVSLHSFTPAMQGFARPWRVGVLHAHDSPLSLRMLDLLRAELGDLAGDNQPYAMDGTDNTVPLHAPRAADYLELEVRQDLLADPAGQDEMAALIGRLLQALA